MSFSFTYTDATLNGDAASADSESIFSGGKDGNQVPYIPEFKFATRVGMEWEKISAYLSANWVSSVYTTASNTEVATDVSGDPDARYGQLDSRWLLDFSAYYQLTENVELFGTVQNLLDEEYVASRHPHGPRPGAPRMYQAGVDIRF